MSVRLNVVLSQSAAGSPRQRDFESEVVARLIAAAGIDLSLIGPIESIEVSATDRLMLDGLRSDLALLSWFAPEDAANGLTRAGIDGRRAPHRLDSSPGDGEKSPSAATAAPRRIYYFDLRQSTSAGALQSALEELLAARRVVTFPLLAGGSTGRGGPGDDGASGAPVRAESSANLPVAPRDRDAGSPPSKPPSGDARSAATSSAAVDHGSVPRARAVPRKAEPDRWDALVDELNDTDI